LTANRCEILVHIPMTIVIEGIKPRKDTDQVDLSVLTNHERTVFEKIRSGLSNKEIAAELNRTERTVKFHASSLYAKLDGVSSRRDIQMKFGKGSDGGKA
jgi:DNA-binding NarL/FixJ family response regulator